MTGSCYIWQTVRADQIAALKAAFRVWFVLPLAQQMQVDVRKAAFARRVVRPLAQQTPDVVRKAAFRVWFVLPLAQQMQDVVRKAACCAVGWDTVQQAAYSWSDLTLRASGNAL